MKIKIDFSTELKSFDGRGIAIAVNEAGGAETIATLKWAAVEAVMHPSNEPLSASEIMRRFALATDIHNADGPLAVSVEDIALIRAMIPLRFPHPVIAAPALKALGENGL